MSLMLALCPMVIAMGVSASSASMGLLLNRTQNAPCELPILTTRFADEMILKQTLESRGLTVQQTKADDFTVQTAAGTLHYFRTAKTEPYQMEALHVKNLPVLLDALESLNREYGCNVQKYTYDLILKGINEHGMKLESETVTQDDTILLTLSL